MHPLNESIHNTHLILKGTYIFVKSVTCTVSTDHMDGLDTPALAKRLQSR